MSASEWEQEREIEKGRAIRSKFTFNAARTRLERFPLERVALRSSTANVFDVVAVVAALTCAALPVCVCMCVCVQKKPAKQAKPREQQRERERERLHWKVNRGRKKNRLTGQQIMLRYILRQVCYV